MVLYLFWIAAVDAQVGWCYDVVATIISSTLDYQINEDMHSVRTICKNYILYIL